MQTWTLDGKEIQVYTVGPYGANMTVVVVGDIFSMHVGRAKACCDFLAQQGFRVVFPDLHKGDPVANECCFYLKLTAWFEKHPVDEVVRMLADTFAIINA